MYCGQCAACEEIGEQRWGDEVQRYECDLYRCEITEYVHGRTRPLWCIFDSSAEYMIWSDRDEKALSQHKE